MKSTHSRRLALVGSLAILFSLACRTAYTISTPVPVVTGEVETRAAQTVNAFASLESQPTALAETIFPPTWTATASKPPPLPTAVPTKTGTTVPSLTPIKTMTPNRQVSPTLAGTTTLTSICNKAQFVADVTIPDGTQLPPNTSFTKVWRIRNIGDCTWDSSYRFVFISGEKMSAANINLPQVAAPGETVDVAVNFMTPTKPAFYKSNWMLEGGGDVFGGGSNGDQPFWVLVEVVDNPQYIVYNFAQNYCRGTWESGAGQLPCPGKIGDPDGFVYLLSNPNLETHRENEPVIWTNPDWEKDGWISGRYPTIRIKDSYRFMADIGCLGDFRKCSVTFELYYELASDNIQLLGTWDEVNDGVITRVDLDLSFLAGKSVHLILVTRVNGGPPDQAAGFWLVPQIRTP
jgi:Ig-like domain from next to BRCA1 gene